MIPRVISRMWYNSGNKDVMKHLHKIEEFYALSDAEQDEVTWHRLFELVRYARAHVPFYKRAYGNTLVDTPGKFRNLPIVTKKSLHDHNSEFLSDEFDAAYLKRVFTSGTTGIPVGVYLSPEAKLIKKATLLYGYHMMGYKIGDRVAVLWGCSQYFKLRRWKDLMENVLLNTHELRTFELSEEKMVKYARLLEKVQPEYIESYVSSVEYLAHVCKKHDIIIRPKAIQVTSEMLPQKTRFFVENVFGCKVFNKYGANELGPIAQECQHHDGMHIYRHNVFVEVLKDHRILLTGLTNRAMPLIRFEIGDLGMLSETICPCGKRRGIMSLEGRLNDLIVTSDGRRIDSYYFVTLMDRLKTVKQFKIIQDTDYSVRFLIVSRDKNAKGRILESMRSLDPKLTVQVDYRNTIIVPKGKMRYVESKVQK